MLNIEKYLEKFFKNVNSIETNKKQILDIIEKYTQIKLSSENIEIKNYIVFVKTSPAALNKIFIYKSKILEGFAGLMPEQKIIDIK